MPVHFFFADTKINLTQRTPLRKFIEGIFKKEGKQLYNLNYIFCSDEYLLDINQRFFIYFYYTDIITFDISEKGMPVDAEIYISIDRVKENAMTEGKTTTNELHRVLFHGVLHLCGQGDKSMLQKKQMRKKEDYYLRKYFS